MDGPGDYYNLSGYNNTNTTNTANEVQPSISYVQATVPLPQYPVPQETITTIAPSYNQVYRPVSQQYTYHSYSRPQVSQPQTSLSVSVQTATVDRAVPDIDVSGIGSQQNSEPLSSTSTSCSASAPSTVSTSSQTVPENLSTGNIPQLLPPVVYDPTGIEIRPTIAFPEIVAHLYVDIRCRIVALGDVLNLIFADLVRLTTVQSAATRHFIIQRLHENVINVRDRLNGLLQVIVTFRRNHSEPFPSI